MSHSVSLRTDWQTIKIFHFSESQQHVCEMSYSELSSSRRKLDTLLFLKIIWMTVISVIQNSLFWQQGQFCRHFMGFLKYTLLEKDEKCLSRQNLFSACGGYEDFVCGQQILSQFHINTLPGAANNNFYIICEEALTKKDFSKTKVVVWRQQSSRRYIKHLILKLEIKFVRELGGKDLLKWWRCSPSLRTSVLLSLLKYSVGQWPHYVISLTFSSSTAFLILRSARCWAMCSQRLTAKRNHS